MYPTAFFGVLIPDRIKKHCLPETDERIVGIVIGLVIFVPALIGAILVVFNNVFKDFLIGLTICSAWFLCYEAYYLITGRDDGTVSALDRFNRSTNPMRMSGRMRRGSRSSSSSANEARAAADPPPPYQPPLDGERQGTDGGGGGGHVNRGMQDDEELPPAYSTVEHERVQKNSAEAEAESIQSDDKDESENSKEDNDKVEDKRSIASSEKGDSSSSSTSRKSSLSSMSSTPV